jgi:hypothetical protein
MRRLQRMTVGADDSKILASVVGRISIDVIELDRNHAITGPAFGPAA